MPSTIWSQLGPSGQKRVLKDLELEAKEVEAKLGLARAAEAESGMSTVPALAAYTDMCNRDINSLLNSFDNAINDSFCAAGDIAMQVRSSLEQYSSNSCPDRITAAAHTNNGSVPNGESKYTLSSYSPSV